MYMMESYSDSDDSSVAENQQAHNQNEALHDRLTIDDMKCIKVAFDGAIDGKMTATELRHLLKTMLKIEYDDDEFKILFLKINTSRTGEVNWDELVSHLILGYFGNDAENQKGSLQYPIMGRPVVMHSEHKLYISKICFCPDVAKDRSTDPMQGSYITASRDGMINWWSLDMKLLRTAYSSCPDLKIQTTWVTDLVCMPDVNIIVTSSTERDLRFYDCTAKTFILKIIITSWEYMICSMFYYFHKDDIDQCKLICGDVGGNVRVLQFSAKLRGPFKGEAGQPMKKLRYVDLQMRPHMLPELRLRELLRVHSEWVRQVSYYESLHCVVSCATCPDSLLMFGLHCSKTNNMFRIEKGIQCFAFDEEAHVLVTGGPDCVVRVWNPFVPTQASVTLNGHHAGVICIVLQNQGQTIYSLSREGTIKVWDVQGQVCRQTYNDIPAKLSENSPISAVYNSATRQFILGSTKIAIVVLDEQLNPLHTDGFTHSRGVSKVLYNPLFKVIITCGMDSIIINWNPLTGKRNVMIRSAHVRKLHSALFPVEITAACFDPGYLLLLTGARSGQLKVWNFNTGVCMRVMEIEYMCEVTSCFWVEGRILAVGWNRHVVEFEDTGMATTGKSWDSRHTDDVLAAAVRPPLTLATASYNSELVFWRLETSQPYRRFLCTKPTQRIKVDYGRRDDSKSLPPIGSKGSRPSPIIWFTTRKPPTAASEYVLDPEEAIKKAAVRCLTSTATPGQVPDPQAAIKKGAVRCLSSTAMSMPGRAQSMLQLAVQAMIFLQTRPSHTRIASLLLALENGNVQCWSDHSAGGYLGSFQAIHMADDYVSSFATDVDNEFLFTGTIMGYVKVWLMSNFLINKQVHVNMPRLRLLFPFLWRDRIEGRAKRCVRDQPLPLLLNSYRAHMRSVNTIAFINELKLVLTGSADYSVRLWRLSGEYLQTLGSFVPWTLDVTRFPPDVKKVASFTTFKVWRGGEVSRFVPGQKEVDRLLDISEDELQHETFGHVPDEPLLGHHSSLPVLPDRQDDIQLNNTLPVIPLYKYLRLASTTPVRRPPTPELVRRMRMRDRPKKMQFGDDTLQSPRDPLQQSRAYSTHFRQSRQSTFFKDSTLSRPSTISRPSTLPRRSTFSKPSTYSTPSAFSKCSTSSRPSMLPGTSTFTKPCTPSRPSTFTRPSTLSRPSTPIRPSILPKPSTLSRPSILRKPSTLSKPSTLPKASTLSRPSILSKPSTLTRPSMLTRPSKFSRPPSVPRLPSFCRQSTVRYDDSINM